MTVGHHILTLAALALREGYGEAQALAHAAGPSLKEPLQAALAPFAGKPEAELKQAMEARLKTLATREAFLGIAEIHPAWLVESLKKESPRVIGVILRHLPSKHVRYLLEHLPRRIVLKLPKLVESFYVSSDILKIVRGRFERQFVPMRVSHQIDCFEFSHLHCLKIEELEVLLDSLGLSELALALVHSAKKILRTVVHRFGIGEGREILNRVKRFRGQPAWLIREARYSVLSQKGKGQGTGAFLRELGFLSLAKSFGSEDGELFEPLKQKLAPPEAYLLKRSLEEQFAAFSPKAVERSTLRQAFVLDHLRELCEAGKIDPLWMESLKRDKQGEAA